MTADVSTLGSTEWRDLDIRKLICFTTIATLLENGLMYPFWCMKTRQQVQSGDLTHHLSIRKMGGLRSLYRGFAFYAFASLPAYLVYLTAYTYSKSALGLHYDGKQDAGGAIICGSSSSNSNSNNNSMSHTSSYAQVLAPLAAGIIADAACLGLYMPVEIAAQRLQLPTRYANAREVLQAMWREGRLSAFYRGFHATVVTSAVASGVWWCTYENFKKLFSASFLASPAAGAQTKRPSRTVTRSRAAAKAHDGLQRPLTAGRLRERAADALVAVRQSLPHMAAGFLAGATCACITNPLDIVKTRIQTQHGQHASAAFLTGLREVVRQEGLRKSMLRGLAPKIMSTAPLGMISSVVYESILFLSRKDRNAQAKTKGEGRD